MHFSNFLRKMASPFRKMHFSLALNLHEVFSRSTVCFFCLATAFVFGPCHCFFSSCPTAFSFRAPFVTAFFCGPWVFLRAWNPCNHVKSWPIGALFRDLPYDSFSGLIFQVFAKPLGSQAPERFYFPVFSGLFLWLCIWSGHLCRSRFIFCWSPYSP